MRNVGSQLSAQRLSRWGLDQHDAGVAGGQLNPAKARPSQKKKSQPIPGAGSAFRARVIELPG
jgi:hypothetical protein